MNTDEHMLLLDNLQSLLEKQIEMARRDDFRRLEMLAEQAGHVVDKIVKIKLFGQPEFDGRRKHLVKLYKKLELMLAAGKASVGKQLRQVGNVKKTLKVYRSSS
ncbi:MAG: hypothetical protein ACYSSI_00860 [Planctomycetota bacterium]